MRTEKAIELDDGRLVIVKELRVKDVRKLLQFFTPEMAQLPMAQLLQEQLPQVVTFVGDCLTLPESESIDDLSLSECEAIGEAWWEIHKGFFLRLTAAGHQVTALGMKS